MNTVSERLRVVRTALKLTQEGFGKPFGLNRANIRDLESGKVKISQLHLISFQSVYSINHRWLLHEEGPMILNKEVNSGSLSIHESLNVALLKLVIEASEEYLEKTKSYLPADLKSKMISLIYEEYKDDKKVTKKQILRDVKLIEKTMS